MRRIFPYIIVIFVCFVFLFNDSGISPVFGYLILFCFFILELFEAYITNKLCLNNKLLPTFGILALILLTSLYKMDFSDRTKLFYLIIALTAFCGMSVSEYNELTARKMSKTFVFAGVLFSSIIYLYFLFPDAYTTLILPWLSDESRMYVERLVGLGYSVSVAGSISYTLLVIITSIFFVLYSDYSNTIKHRLFLVGYLLGAVIISQRRTELVGVLATIVVVCMFVNRRYIRNFIKKHPITLLLSITAIVIGIIWVVSFINSLPSTYHSDSRILTTMWKLKMHQDVSNGRSELYDKAISLFKNNSMIGIGWMNFSKYSGETGILIVRNVHNIYLQLITECGLVFGVPIIILLLSNLFRAIKMVRKNGKQVVGTAILIYICIAGLADNTIYYPYFWIFYMVALYMAGFTSKSYECSKVRA